MRIALGVALTLCLALTGFSVGRAYERDETSLTVQVSAADHELEEGYFSLGDKATVLAKPGTDLFRFFSRNRGRKVRILLQEAAGPEPPRLDR